MKIPYLIFLAGMTAAALLDYAIHPEHLLVDFTFGFGCIFGASVMYFCHYVSNK